MNEEHKCLLELLERLANEVSADDVLKDNIKSEIDIASGIIKRPK